MPRVHQVKAARKDYPQFGIKKGDSYYHWSFRYGPEMKSKTYPTRSQLTRSAFLQQLYDLEDNLEKDLDRDDLESSVSEITDQIQELIDMCQDSLDNMPEALQESSDTGMLLQERIDALESWMSDLESIDVDVPDVEDFELDVEQQAEVDMLPEDEREDHTLELKEEKRQERIDEIVEEITSTGAGL